MTIMTRSLDITDEVGYILFGMVRPVSLDRPFLLNEPMGRCSATMIRMYWYGQDLLMRPSQSGTVKDGLLPGTDCQRQANGGHPFHLERLG